VEKEELGGKKGEGERREGREGGDRSVIKSQPILLRSTTDETAK
jgi:hypothetical protein